MDGLTRAIHTCDPYADFNMDQHKVDLQGWNSNGLVFEKLIKEIKPSLIIEVGTWKGASAIHMAKIIKKMRLNCKICCVDTWLGGAHFRENKEDSVRFLSLNLKHGYPMVYFQFLHNVIYKQVQDIIIPFPMDSVNASKWFELFSIKADLIYIDGNHEEDSVYADLKNYFPLLTKKGVMFGDDFRGCWKGVQAAVKRFAKEKDFELDEQNGFFILRRNNSDMTQIHDQSRVTDV